MEELYCDICEFTSFNYGSDGKRILRCGDCEMRIRIGVNKDEM